MKTLLLALLLCSYNLVLADAGESQSNSKSAVSAGLTTVSLASYTLTRKAAASSKENSQGLFQRDPHVLNEGWKKLNHDDIDKIAAKVHGRDSILVTMASQNPEVVKASLLENASFYRSLAQKYSGKDEVLKKKWMDLAKDAELKASNVSISPYGVYRYQKVLSGNLAVKLKQLSRSNKIGQIYWVPSPKTNLINRTIGQLGLLTSVTSGYAAFKNFRSGASSSRLDNSDRINVAEKPVTTSQIERTAYQASRQ